MKAARHGAATARYIDYNRRDVLATSELAVSLLREFPKAPNPSSADKSILARVNWKGISRPSASILVWAFCTLTHQRATVLLVT